MTYRTKKIKIASVVSGVFFASLFSLPFVTSADSGPNTIVNPNFETASSTNATFPEHWNKGFWGTNNAVFTYPAPDANGAKAAKVEITSYASGDAKWYFDDVPTHPGEQYVFSDRYITDVLTDIVVRYTLLDGTFRYEYLGTPVVSATWTGYATLPFTIPENVSSLTVFHLIHMTGSLSIDDAALRRFTKPALPQTPEMTVPAGTVSATGAGVGGTISLSFLRASNNVLPAFSSIPPPNTKSLAEQSPAVVHNKNFAAIGTTPREKSSFFPVANAGNAVNQKDPASLVSTALAAEKPLLNNFPRKEKTAAAHLGALVEGFSDLALVFSGLLLVVFSIGLTLILISNSKKEEGTSLWKP
jgi:hypothetical protein